jgi:uncharacterized protein YbjT (DUF2867 family)
MPSANNSPPILVTGAAGKTGRAVIRRLAAKGAPIRAFVRRPSQRQPTERIGAHEVIEGDLRSRETVAEAVRGIEAIYHICPNVHPDEVSIGRRIVAGALAAGVRRIVYHSVLHPQIEAMPHHWAKLRVEELLFESGLDYSILQPAPYMQNVFGQWRSITEDAEFPVPYGLHSRVAMVDLEDVAEAATRVLTETDRAGATYELCGPGLLDQLEIAAALGHGLGRTVRAVEIPRRKWAQDAAEAGLGDYRIATLLSMFTYYERFGMAGTPHALTCLLGHSPSSFEEFVARTAGSTSGPTL